MAVGAERLARSAASSSSETREQAAQRMGQALKDAEVATRQANALREQTQHFLMFDPTDPDDTRAEPSEPELEIQYLKDPFSATGSRQNPPHGSIFGATPFKRLAPPPQRALTDAVDLPPAEEGSEGWSLSVAPPWTRPRMSIFDPLDAKAVKQPAALLLGPSAVKNPAASSSAPSAAASFPGTLSRNLRKVQHDYIRSGKSEAPPQSTPTARKEQRDKISHINEELERMQQLLMSDDRSPETLLDEMLKLEMKKKQMLKDQKAANPKPGKTKRRLVGKQRVSPTGRGLIHVPDPVLPHNDVGNDPYLIKSQHNNISA
jgi:hypothetical protein